MLIHQSASMSFEDSWQHESVALYTNDHGQELIDAAKEFCEWMGKLDKNSQDISSQEIMFMFCNQYLAGLDADEHPFINGLYFGMDGEDGNNSELGHHVIDILTRQVVRQFMP